MRATALLTALLAGCARASPDPWPAWPRSAPEARALLARATRSAPAPTEREASYEALTEGLSRGRFEAGEEALCALLRERALRSERAGRSFVLLVGSLHDAPGQLRAVGRWLGPWCGFRPTLLALEQLAARGRWVGADPRAQAGDDALLARYAGEGSPAALAAVQRAHQARDHAAWRYDYDEEVLSLLAQARGLGVPVRGSDLPSGLAFPPGSTPELRTGLRELHATLALRSWARAARGPTRAVLFWGDAHVGPEGLRRFLPAEWDALVLDLVGERRAALAGAQEDGPTESTLYRAGWRFASEVAVPLAPSRYGVVLRDGWLGAGLERARGAHREGDPFSDAPPGVAVFAAYEPFALRVGEGELRPTAESHRVVTGPGTRGFVAQWPGRNLVGALTLREGEGAQLVLQREPAEVHETRTTTR